MAGLCLVEKAQEADPQVDEATKQLLAEMAAQTKATNAAIEALTKALKPADAPATPATPAEVKVEFEGNANDPADLAAQREKIMLAKCDLSTEKGLAAWEAYQASKTKRVAGNKAVKGGMFTFAAEANTADEQRALEAAGLEAIKRLNGGA
jgi:hypothetical protein